MGAPRQRTQTPTSYERSLQFVVLRALGDPGVAPCPVCGGHLDEITAGVACAGCGSEIVRGREQRRDDGRVVTLAGRASR